MNEGCINASQVSNVPITLDYLLRANKSFDEMMEAGLGQPLLYRANRTGSTQLERCSNRL